jgi:hypothetical protein
MTENITFRDIVVKLLAITGFLVTIAVILWGAIEGAKRAPQAFSSLASIAESIERYRPQSDSSVIEVAVTEEVSTPSATPETEVAQNYPVIETPREEVATATPTTPEPKKEVLTVTVGSSDLKMTILGSGIIKNEIFSYTNRYDSDERNALRFDVKNVGSQVSDIWYFNVVLPSGKVYTSPKQVALRPQDHIEFTLGFYLDEETGEYATLTTMIESNKTFHSNGRFYAVTKRFAKNTI